MATTWQPIGPGFDLPVVGGDNGTWGEKLNAAIGSTFTEIGHDPDAGTMSLRTKAGDVVTIDLPPGPLPSPEQIAVLLAANPDVIEAAADRALTTAGIVTVTLIPNDPVYATVTVDENDHILYAEKWNGQVEIPGLDAVKTPPAKTGLAILRGAATHATVAPVAVVFAGSSTTAGLWSGGNPKSYVERLIGRMRARWAPAVTPSAVQWNADATFTKETGAGIHGYNSAVSGANATSYLTNAECDRIADLNPAAIIHMIGSNEYAAGSSLPAYTTNLTNRLNYLDGVLATPCVHILVHQHLRSGVTDPINSWTAYGEAMRQIAAADPARRVFVGTSEAFEAAGLDGTTADPLGLFSSDHVHLNEFGHSMMADLIATELGI